MVRRYETVYIFDSSLEEPQVTEKLTRLHALLTTGGQGTITNVAHWGKRQLAYRLKKKDAGYYVVAQFESEPGVLPEYERAVRLEETVLRYLVVAHEEEPVKPMPATVATDLEETEEDDA